MEQKTLQERAREMANNDFGHILADMPEGINKEFSELYTEITGEVMDCSVCNTASEPYSIIVTYAETGTFNKPKEKPKMKTQFRLKEGVQLAVPALSTVLVNDTDTLTDPNAIYAILVSDGNRNAFQQVPDDLDSQLAAWKDGTHPKHPKQMAKEAAKVQDIAKPEQEAAKVQDIAKPDEQIHGDGNLLQDGFTREAATSETKTIENGTDNAKSDTKKTNSSGK